MRRIVCAVGPMFSSLSPSLLPLPPSLPPSLPLSSRLQRLEMLAAKFDAKAGKVEAWAAGKDEALLLTEDIDTSNLAEIMVSRLHFQDTGLGHLFRTLSISGH